ERHRALQRCPMGSGAALATAGLALARSRARPAPSAWRAVPWRGTAAEMGDGENACAGDALVTGTCARRADGREAPPPRGGCGGPGVRDGEACHAVRRVQHEGS